MADKSYQIARLSVQYTSHAIDRGGDDGTGDVGWRTATVSMSLRGEVHLPGVPMMDIAELAKALNIRKWSELYFTSTFSENLIETISVPDACTPSPRQLLIGTNINFCHGLVLSA